MKGADLAKLGAQYPDYDFEFSFTDGYSTFPNVRTFKNLEIQDVGHSEKAVSLTGDEEK